MLKPEQINRILLPKHLSASHSHPFSNQSNQTDINSMEQRVEPILQENPNRFVIFPLQHNDI